MSKENHNCCNQYEFEKMEVWSLIKYKYIFLLDWDIRILQNINELFYCMESDYYDFLGTNGIYGPLNGGMWILKPNLNIYYEIKYLLKYGNYTNENGWFNSNIEHFYGAETNQGFGFWYFFIYKSYLLKKNNNINNINLNIPIPRGAFIPHGSYNCQGNFKFETKIDHKCRTNVNCDEFCNDSPACQKTGCTKKLSNTLL